MTHEGVELFSEGGSFYYRDDSPSLPAGIRLPSPPTPLPEALPLIPSEAFHILFSKGLQWGEGRHGG